MDIVDVLKNMPDYIGADGATEEEISQSEKILGIKFFEDYREYLKEVGVACFDGHELTGLCKNIRLNVVNVTIEERKNNPDIPFDWYVVEQANIDGIVIWQNQNGEIYESQPSAKSVKISDTMVEYIIKE